MSRKLVIGWVIVTMLTVYPDGILSIRVKFRVVKAKEGDTLKIVGMLDIV
jgi:hypothetical protein